MLLKVNTHVIFA